MKIALCGFPFSGRSTVFKALAAQTIQPKSTAGGKIHLNISTLELKDERLGKLAAILNSEKITYPKISLVDMIHSTDSPAKIDTAHLKEFDALAVVIAVFSSKNPVEDFTNIELEFILADIEVLQNRVEKVEKERKARPKKEEDPETQLLQKCIQALEKKTPLKGLKLSSEELKILAGFQLLTLKPMIVVANISEEQLNKGGYEALQEKAKKSGLKFFSLCAKLESEIEELPEKERPQFMQEMGLSGLSRDRFIQLCSQAQDKILFFTVVGKEARAWPITRGTTAQQAAGTVHSDMERGFIRAEVINYKDFVECGSFAKAKEKGLLRLESKEYLVQDADIINFKFSV